MSSVFSLEDVVYVIYETACCIESASYYGCDLYANALGKVSSDTTECEETIYVYKLVWP